MVLLYFACLKKLAEAHFGHERGWHTDWCCLGTMTFADPLPPESRSALRLQSGLHIYPLSLVVPVGRFVDYIEFREGKSVALETERVFSL